MALPSSRLPLGERSRGWPHLRDGGRPAALRVFALLGLVLAGYWVSVLVRHGRYSTALDGWLVDGVELVAGSLCIVGGFRRRHVRFMAIALGCGLICWSLGDSALTIESLGGATPPTPSVADAFYLCFYPCMYMAVLAFMRTQLRRLPGPSWLDGVVAGLGSAALCAAFAFHDLVHAAGTGTEGTIVNLAYPIGDLILLGLVVGGNALVSGPRRAVWALLSAGMALVAVGDTINLFSTSLASSGVGTFVNAVAWPTATLVMAIAPWLRTPPADIVATAREPGFALPGVAVTCALGLVFVATVHHVNRVALGLAAATLIVAGARLLLSVRALRALSLERHNQAITDELTGLGNRRYLSGLLDDFFAQDDDDSAGPGRSLAFLFVDLDHFKEINDSFGHPAGDELLRLLGPRLRDCLRSTDVVVRLGGDEFAILLPGSDSAYAVEVAQRVTARLEEPFVLNAVRARIGASIGIAMASSATGASDLMWSADTAMYRAKHGGSGFAVHGQEPDGAQGMQLAEELSDAITKDQLVLHYQPLMDLRSGDITGVEALLRWAHPALGLVPPLQFLPLAEEAGLMYRVTEVVLEKALSQVAAWRSEGRGLSVSVNISASSLLEAGFPELVQALLTRHQLDAEAVVLEITETCVVRDFEQCRGVVEQLRQLGLVVSIDDFGAGATSLAYLTNLGGVGELKLDRSFISGLSLPDKKRELELVRATIELGHAMGLRVVAEGIEDSVTLDLLSQLGCDLAQGYFISRPKPAQELTFRSNQVAPV